MTSPTTDRSLASPSLSSSSFDMLSSSFSVLSERALRDLDDEDQIVWSIAGTGSSENSSDTDNNSINNSADEESSLDIRSNANLSLASDDDCVVLPTSLSPRLGLTLPAAVAPVSDLVSKISRMALNASPISCASTPPAPINQTEARNERWRRRQLRQSPVTASKPSSPKKHTPKAKKIKPAVVAPQRTATVTPLRLALPAASTSASGPKPKPVTKKQKQAKAAKKLKRPAPAPATPSVAEPLRGLGERPIVKDDVSEFGDASAYEKASSYISTFLSDKEVQEQTPRLSLLHALIIELDLLPASNTTLPPSLTSAKALLKSKAFLNIREYIAAREKGPSALQAIMHPNRRALVKSLRQNRNPASLKWVKANGLQVLLVHCF